MITFSGGELSIWQSEMSTWKCLETKTIQPNGSAYQKLKAYAHHVLLIDAMLEKGFAVADDKEMQKEWLKEMADLQRDVMLLLSTHDHSIIEHYGSLITHMFEESCILLTNVMLSVNTHGQLRKEELSKWWTSYQLTVRSALQYVAESGASYQINALRQCMSDWVQQYSLMSQAKYLRIMLPVAHEPRKKNLEAQYFCKLMQQLTEEENVKNNYVYILEESPQFLSVIHQDIPGQLLSQLHRLEANNALGKRIFNDSHMMYSDVLSNSQKIQDELNRPLL